MLSSLLLILDLQFCKLMLPATPALTHAQTLQGVWGLHTSVVSLRRMQRGMTGTGLV